MRSQESCLLARMGHLDGEAREAAARRQVAVRQEQLARDETSAYFAAYVRGRHGPMHEGAAPHLRSRFSFCDIVQNLVSHGLQKERLKMLQRGLKRS